MKVGCAQATDLISYPASDPCKSRRLTKVPGKCKTHAFLRGFCLAPHIGRQSNKGTSLHDSFPMHARWHLKPEGLAKSPLFVPKWRKRAARWAAGLAAGKWPSRAALARAEGVSRAYVTQVLVRLDSASNDRTLYGIDAGPTSAICCPQHPETAEAGHQYLARHIDKWCYDIDPCPPDFSGTNATWSISQNMG